MALRNKAADLIEEYGWQQCNYGDTRRGFCATGALMYAGGAVPTDGVLLSDLVYDELSGPLMETFGGLISWNDARGRTKDEVIALLRGKAA